jgi:hypothetical protein
MYKVYQPGLCPPVIYDKSVKTGSDGNVVVINNVTLASRYSLLSSLALRANGSGSVRFIPNNLASAYIPPPKNYF